LELQEQLKIEAHVSEAASRSLKLEEDESNSKLLQIQQLDANINVLKKELDEFKIKFEQLEAENNDLEKRLDELKIKLQQLEAENNYLKTQLEEKEAVLKRKDAEQKQMQTVIDGLRLKVASLNQTVQISSTYTVLSKYTQFCHRAIINKNVCSIT
jgi:chromosome segregation ATPase